MSVPVQLDDLGAALADFGAGYLLTTTEGRVKTVTVEARVEGDVVRVVWPSRGSAANLAQNPHATLVFWPRQPRGHSLIIDGTATATPDGFDFRPTSAILHRPASHAPHEDTGQQPNEPADDGHDCANDCRHL